MIELLSTFDHEFLKLRRMHASHGAKTTKEAARDPEKANQ
jgi:hypothetical protein